MFASSLSQEERWGLGVSIAWHIALVGVLIWGPSSGDVVLPPQRIVVTLSDNVSWRSTSPSPDEAAHADIAPVVGEAPPEQSDSAPRVETPRDRTAPSTPTLRPQTRPAPVWAGPVGGSRIGDNFLAGSSDAQGSSNTPPAKDIGPRVQASLRSAISRQLKPHWSAPQGADAERLVTLVRFRLNQDGSLAGVPSVSGQSGVTPSNAHQKGRHAEQAIRAVRLAAPFTLPEEFYDGWKVVTSRFDKRLSE